jgi:ABC-type Mn2+/Zn2+ transport system permease subunit
VSDLLETVRLFGPAFAGSVLVALACAVVGVHVVGRRVLLVGVALPQVAAAGIGLSFLAALVPWTAPGTALAWTRDHDLVALLACVAGAAALMERPGAARGRREVRTAATYALGGALSFLLVLGSAGGMEEVRNLVAGDVLGIHGPALGSLALHLAPVLLLHALLFRRFLFVSFDPEMAATLGVRTRLHDLLFHATLAVTVARSVHAAGTLFVFAYLVLPAAGAMRVARRAGAVFALAAAIAGTGAAAGFLVAAHPAVDGPVGPTATAAVLVLFLACLGVRRLLDLRDAAA